MLRCGETRATFSKTHNTFMTQAKILPYPIFHCTPAWNKASAPDKKHQLYFRFMRRWQNHADIFSWDFSRTRLLTRWRLQIRPESRDFWQDWIFSSRCWNRRASSSLQYQWSRSKGILQKFNSRSCPLLKASTKFLLAQVQKNKTSRSSGVTDEAEGWNAPSGNLNVKNGTPLSLYFGFSILLAFNRLLFFTCFGVFSSDLGFHYT